MIQSGNWVAEYSLFISHGRYAVPQLYNAPDKRLVTDGL